MLASKSENPTEEIKKVMDLWNGLRYEQIVKEKTNENN